MKVKKVGIIRNLITIATRFVDALDAIAQALDRGMEIRIDTPRSRSYRDDEISKDLFKQIDKLVKSQLIINKRTSTHRRTAEGIAEAQGRSVIYICPDNTFRNPNGDVIGNKGDSLHGTPYVECIPFSFASEDDFVSWLNEVINKPSSEEVLASTGIDYTKNNTREKHNENRQD